MGQNNSSTLGWAAKWDESSSSYYNYFGTWGQGIDLVWDANYGREALSYSYHTNTGKRVSANVSESYLATGSTLAAATFPPEKDYAADLIWNPTGTFKFIASIAPRDLSSDGRAGYRIWNGLNDVAKYSEFTNRALSVGLTAVCRKTSYAEITLKELKIMRMNAVAGGNVPRIIVPANAAATIKAGEAVPGQSPAVMNVERLELSEGSSLGVMPESNSTKVGISSVSSAGATLAAAQGAKLSLVNELSITSAPDEVGLVVSGDISFGSSLTISIPVSWKKYRAAPITVIDASGAADAFPGGVAGITFVDADGIVDSGKYELSVTDGKLLLDFRKGMTVIVR